MVVGVSRVAMLARERSVGRSVVVEAADGNAHDGVQSSFAAGTTVS